MKRGARLNRKHAIIKRKRARRRIRTHRRSRVQNRRRRDSYFKEDGRVSVQVLRDRQRATFNIPEVFSLSEDPNGTLDFIELFRSKLHRRFIQDVWFNHKPCAVLGLDATAYIDSLLKEETHKRGASITVGGEYPKKQEAALMLRAIGTLRTIRHPDMVLPEELEKKIVRSDTYYGNGKNLYKNKSRDDASTNLVRYYNSVLCKQGFELSDEGKFHMSNLVSEVLGNAEEHGGRWYTRAYSKPTLKKDAESSVEDCEIVIFNFGKTIHESLTSQGASTPVRQRVAALARRHKAAGYFDDRWTEECLWTVSALQQGVSRYKGSGRGATRGNGTINMIEAFSALAQSDGQRMCIISGSAYILFDGTHHLTPQLTEHGQEVKQIAFNKERDLERPAEAKYVYTLKKRFPGTMISLRFSIDGVHLQGLLGH
jgi:hypothetical protein